MKKITSDISLFIVPQTSTAPRATEESLLRAEFKPRASGQDHGLHWGKVCWWIEVDALVVKWRHINHSKLRVWTNILFSIVMKKKKRAGVEDNKRMAIY